MRLLLLLLALPAHAQEHALVDVARKTLAYLQGPSIAHGVEHCGLIGIDRRGAYVALPARRGAAVHCDIRWDVPRGVEVVASYHTHGDYEASMDSEVPSTADVHSDVAEGIDGFVSTPGGRLWFVDWRRREVRQLCGVGCLPRDPAFRPDPDGVAKRYTLRELRRREG